MSQSLLVTAHLAGPLAGDAPQLDGLLEWASSLHCRKPADRAKVDRALPAPVQGEIPVPLGSDRLGAFRVYRASSPILAPVAAETVEHICKRLATEEALLVAPAERRVVTTTNSWTKSYRLPLRIRVVPRVCWFCVGTRQEIKRLLRSVRSIGKKVADGYGRVARWELDPVERDLSWFAPHPSGTVLMRPLPAGDWLPRDLLGFRRDFGACAPPYWHSDRYGEIVSPC